MFKKYEIPLLIVLIFVLLLTLRFLFYLSLKEELKAGQKVEIEHTFLKVPEKNSFQQYFFIDNILVILPLFPEYNYGDTVSLKGIVSSNTSTRESKVIENLVIRNPEVEIMENNILSVLKFIRQKIIYAYNLALPPREAGLISGMVLGVEDGISFNFKEELVKSGMLHVVVASGSNIVLVAGIVLLVLNEFLKNRLAIVLTILTIFIYALLTGFDPPIVRASIMASFGFIAMILGRQGVAFISLLFSAWIMLMFNPKYLTDVGFQLSFAATLGIISFQSVVQSVVGLIPKIIREDFSTTLSAQMGALPVLMFAFSEVNLLSIITNVLLLWTVPIIMIFGLFSGAISLISPLVSQPFLLLIYPFLVLFSETVHISSIFYVPLSSSSVVFPLAVIYYMVFVYLLIQFRFKK